MPQAKIKFKINDLGITDKQYNDLPYGRQIEYRRKFEEFKKRARKVSVSQKRRTHAVAWKEFMKLDKPQEYYTSYYDESSYWDDSFEVWYVTDAVKAELKVKAAFPDAHITYNEAKECEIRATLSPNFTEVIGGGETEDQAWLNAALHRTPV